MEPERRTARDEHSGSANADGDCRAPDSDQHGIASDLHARPANGYPCSANRYAYTSAHLP